jgi:lysophospholipase L1-like esterase
MSAERAKLSRRTERLMTISLLLIPLALLLAVEGLLALKFRREYASSSLEGQGAFRMIAATYRGYQNNPNYIRKHDGVTYRYNNLSFREEEDLGDKAPNEFRVFFLGGSAAYGERSNEGGQFQLISGQKTYPSSETIAAHLERELARELPERDVNVINAAVVGYRVNNDFLTYLELLRHLEPDLLVAMDGHNEVYANVNPFSPAVARTPQELIGPLTRWLRQHSYLAFYGGQLFRESALFNRLTGRLVPELSAEELAMMDAAAIRAENATAARDHEVEAGAIDQIMMVYELFFTATRLDGVPILFTMQPVLALDQTKVLTARESDLLKYLRHTKWPDKYPMLKLDRALAERARRGDGFHYLSLLGVFSDFESDAYTDYCHITPTGNQHIARKLAQVILTTPELRATSQRTRTPAPGPRDRP